MVVRTGIAIRAAKSGMLQLGIFACAVALSVQAGQFQYDGASQKTAYGDEATFTYDDEGRVVSLTFSGGGVDDTIFSGDMAFAPDARICLTGEGQNQLILNGALAVADTLTLTNALALAPYEGAFLPHEGTAVVFRNARVDDYDIVSTMFDTLANHGLGKPHYVVRSEGCLEAQLSIIDGWLKCVKIRLSQAGDDIVGTVVWARYAPVPQDGEPIPDFETLNEKTGGRPVAGEYCSYGIALSKDDESSYGINQLTVSLRNNATVVLNGAVAGDINVSPSVEVKVQNEALAAWSSKVFGARGCVTFVGLDSEAGPVSVARDESNPPTTKPSLFMANQSLAGMKVLSARLGGAAISTTGVDAYVAELKDEGQKASVWLQYLDSKANPEMLKAVKAVFTQVGPDVYVAAECRGYVSQPATGGRYDYGVDLDALIAAGKASTDTKIAADITSVGYCLAMIAVEFPNAAQAVRVNLPGGTTFDSGTFSMEGRVACVAAARDSLPTNGFVTVGSGSRLFASYAANGASDGICGGALDISILSGGSLAITRPYSLVARQPVACDGGEIVVWGFSYDKDAQIPLDNLTLRSGAVIRGAALRMGNDPLSYVRQATLRVEGSSPSRAAAPLLLVGKALDKGIEQTVTFNVADVTGSAEDDFVLEAGIREFSDHQRAPTKVVKTGAGTMSCRGALDYGILSSATTVLMDGVWRLAASSITHGKLDFTIQGGTLAAEGGTENGLGLLSVASSGSLSLDEGASLSFADSSGVTWGNDVRLSIAAEPGATIRFGTSATGLTSAQLSRIRINGNRVQMDGQGYLHEFRGLRLTIR